MYFFKLKESFKKSQQKYTYIRGLEVSEGEKNKDIDIDRYI